LACPRVNARLMFGERAILSSESPVSSARGVREPSVPETALFWIPRLGVGDFPAGCPECRPPEEIRGSRAEVVLEGGVGSGSGMGWSAGNVGVVESAWVLPLSRVTSRSGVWCRIGVGALSRVLYRSEVLGAGDCPRPDLADPVLFRWLQKSEFFPDPFRNSLVLNRLPVGWVLLPWADFVQRPLHPPPRRGFRLVIRVALGMVPDAEFRLVELPSGFPRTGYSSSVSTSRGWE
jgi:hypothetical protein